MRFSDLKQCPFCGNEEFYTNNFMKGTCAYNQRFDGEEASDNSQMYDGLDVYYGKRAYCNNCFAYIGKPETDELSKGARARLKGATDE